MSLLATSGACHSFIIAGQQQPFKRRMNLVIVENALEIAACLFLISVGQVKFAQLIAIILFDIWSLICGQSLLVQVDEVARAEAVDYRIDLIEINEVLR